MRTRKVRLLNVRLLPHKVLRTRAGLGWELCIAIISRRIEHFTEYVLEVCPTQVLSKLRLVSSSSVHPFHLAQLFQRLLGVDLDTLSGSIHSTASLYALSH